MKSICLILMGGIFLSSCTNDNDYFNNIESEQSLKRVVLTSDEASVLSTYLQGASISQNDALKKATAFLAQRSTRSNSSEKINQTYWVKYESSLPHMFSSTSKPDSIPLYLINNSNGGSVLISGDERLPEVLAYTTSGELSLERNGSGSDVFLDMLPQFVSSTIDNFELKYDSILTVVKSKVGMDKQVGPVPLQRVETEYSEWEATYTYAPLTNTERGQDYPYNTMMDRINCGGSLLCPPLGCTTVAIAQILSQHKYPVVFDGVSVNWIKMCEKPQGFDLSSEYLSQLCHMMKSIADDVLIDKSCTGSSSNISKAKEYFLNNGYTTDAISQYDENKIINSLSNSRPLYTRGTNKSTQEGHAWVIDGANKKERTCTERIFEYRGSNPKPSNPIVPSEWKLIETTFRTEEQKFVHCNYGWDGLNNGYYNHAIFNTDLGNFNSELQILPNIKRK